MNQSVWVNFFLKLHSGFKTKWKLNFRKCAFDRISNQSLDNNSIQYILKLESLKMYINDAKFDIWIEAPRIQGMNIEYFHPHLQQGTVK